MSGAPVNDEDPQTRRTALENAISLGRSDLVVVLLQHGAQVNRVSVTQPWRTPFHLALLYYAQDAAKYADIVRTLQVWGADLALTDANGVPARDYAANLGLPLTAQPMPPPAQCVVMPQVMSQVMVPVPVMPYYQHMQSM